MLYTQKKQKKKLLTICYVILAVSIILFYQFHNDIYYLLAKNKENNAGLCLFYNSLNPDLNLEISIIILTLPSCILLNQYYINHLNKFDYYIKERIGFKKYLCQNYIHNFFHSFIFILCIYISMLLFIHFFLTPINFLNNNSILMTNHAINMFCENTFFNLLIYLILSSFGFSLFSTLILSLKNLFKQKYIFKVSSIFIGIILSVIPTIVGNQLFTIFNNNYILIIFSTLSLFNLLFPGITGFSKFGHLSSPILIYTISFVVFSTITLAIIKFEMKREYSYEA